MNTIKKVSPVKLSNNIFTFTNTKTNEKETLYHKLQNIEAEKIELMDKKMEKVKEEIELAKEKKQNMENIKAILEKLVVTGIVTLDELKSLNRSISKVENLSPEDYESLYRIFSSHSPSIDSPKNVLEKNGITLEEFNNFIKESIGKDKSTKKGVILVGLALAEYSLITNENFRYNVYYATRSEMEGIQENTYLDCSSFVFWALYNGGYNWPVISESQKDEYYTIISNESHYDKDSPVNDGKINNNFELSAWAKVNNLLHDPKEYNGKQGDFLLVNSENTKDRHIMMILEENNDNYYVLEERGNENGLILNKRPKEEIIQKGYKVVDMQPYYNDDNNKRK